MVGRANGRAAAVSWPGIEEFTRKAVKHAKSRGLINREREYRLRGDDNERQGGRAQCPRCTAGTVIFLYLQRGQVRGPCYATFVTVYRGPCHGINRRNISGFEGELSARTYEPLRLPCTPQSSSGHDKSPLRYAPPREIRHHAFYLRLPFLFSYRQFPASS